MPPNSKLPQQGNFLFRKREKERVREEREGEREIG
jgi:hypothetical protein